MSSVTVAGIGCVCINNIDFGKSREDALVKTKMMWLELRTWDRKMSSQLDNLVLSKPSLLKAS